MSLTRQDASLSLLSRLVDDALDPGYRQAAARGTDRRRSRLGRSFLLGMAVAALAALVVATVIQVRKGAPADSEARDELRDRVVTQTASLHEMDGRVDDLSAQVTALRQQVLNGSVADRSLSDEAQTLESQVGVAPVTGSGLDVVLQDGPPTSTGDGEPDLARVLDTDIQLVVNGLFAAGATAVSVDGQRITSVSPIRSAGEAILVDFRPLTPPYTVSAVGPASLLADFENGQARAELHDLETSYGLDVSVTPRDDVTVPGHGDIQLRYAQSGGKP